MVCEWGEIVRLCVCARFETKLVSEGNATRWGAYSQQVLKSQDIEIKLHVPL